MFLPKNKKRAKTIDGLRKKQRKRPKKVGELKFKSKKFWMKMQKPLRVVLIIIGLFLILAGILYLIPPTRAKIDLVRMLWSGKYLVLFQNNAELRPTGGFIGSFAIIDTKYGRVKNTYFDSNIYKRDNEFNQKYQFIPKNESLENISPAGYVTMRDSNWLLDFSEAAKQISWFYQQEGGTNVDGVIAIDTEFFKNLLAIIGPVNLPKYDLEISTDNFLKEVQTEVEKDYFKDLANTGVNEPKSILADMMPTVLARTKNSKNWLKLYQFIFNELKQKHLLLYSYKPSIQSTIVENNWGGTVPNFQFNDYLYINNSNLGANKSSIFVYENIEINIQSTNDGLIHNIKLTKNYPEIDLSELEYIDPNNTKNKNYTRILIPMTNTDIHVFENGNDMVDYQTISEESGKTKISFWTTTEKGLQSIYEISYKISTNNSQNFGELYLQKQPGAVNQTIKVIIDEQVKYNEVFDQDLKIK